MQGGLCVDGRWANIIVIRDTAEFRVSKFMVNVKLGTHYTVFTGRMHVP